jgi:predicted AAA+ superfamily ATPase
VLEAPALALILGTEAQKEAVVGNVERLAAGASAHDMLLGRARHGQIGPAAAAVASAAAAHPGRIALVQANADASLSTLFAAARRTACLPRLHRRSRFRFTRYRRPRKLRSWLEGGVEARPANVRLAVTSNRRAIVERHMSEQDDPINPRDVVDDQLALADRFGLSLGFHACSQDDYLAIISAMPRTTGSISIPPTRSNGPAARCPFGPRRLALCRRTGRTSRTRNLNSTRYSDHNAKKAPRARGLFIFIPSA